MNYKLDDWITIRPQITTGNWRGLSDNPPKFRSKLTSLRTNSPKTNRVFNTSSNMRKIWSRNSKDKRRSFSTYPTPAPSHADDSASELVPDRSLVRNSYDSSSAKHSWVNVINTSVSDISESSLRLARAELKGSFLYIYKSSLYRSFSVDSEPDRGLTAIPTNTTATTVAPSSSTPSHLATKPHPLLRTDDGVAEGPVEAVVHTFLFDRDNTAMVAQLQTTLPLRMDFAACLETVCAYLDAFASIEDAKLEEVLERIFTLLQTINTHFKGFLLKQDVAPHILRLLEALGSLGPQIDSFKAQMLANQQSLIALVSNNDTNVVTTELNPFKDLDAVYFLSSVNIVQFTATINAIDRKFFGGWNPNIDKSLLLWSSVNATDYFYKKNPLFFNNESHIHYLGRLLINHLFLEATSNSSVSVLEFKARVLEKWIDLGCLLDKSGNMSSWLGIASIVLSQPMLRLTRIWSYISPDYLKLLKNDWCPVLFELDRRFLTHGSATSAPSSPTANESERDSYHIMAPRGLGKVYPKENVIAYFGDLTINNRPSKTASDLESIWKKVNYSFSRWDEYIAGLTNYPDIIKYNEDVLKRYDNMDFIFSNESLNQVLYLGVNNDDSKPIPQTFEVSKTSYVEVNEKWTFQLLKLIDLNCESINLDRIMSLSLAFEPELPESYLVAPPSFPTLHHNGSSISLNSSDSGTSASSSTINEAANPQESGPTSKLPLFNNNYFKLALSKYDETLPSAPTNPLVEKDLKHNITVDRELSFRIDDFVNDFDAANGINTLDDIGNVDDEEDVPGLGIDVDDILSSDKFRNFSLKHSNSQSSNEASATSAGVSSPPTATLHTVISGESSQLQIYKYIPKYASIDKLIDLLVVDSKFMDESITIDLTEYRFVFLLSYNSFITTRELLDKLAHRFINSGNAVISIMKKQFYAKTEKTFEQEFPNWNLDSSVDLNDLGEVDYSILLRIQINILKVLVVLINNFYHNFSMDLVNKKILIKLLKLFSNEILQWYNSNKIDANLEKSFENLVNYYKKLKKLFVKKTYRPVEITKFEEYLITEFKFTNSLHEVPMNRNLPGHKNVSKIEKFLHKFNKLLAVFYKGIRTEDWFRAYKVLEIQFEKSGLLDFNLQKTNVADENLIVSNIFNYFDSLTDLSDKTFVLQKFPLVFRKLFKLYYKFKTYLLIQLTDLNVTVDERLDRMQTLLIMVRVCQLKMQQNQFVFEGKGDIPSCIETAVTNVIYSPESRMFTNLWIKAANSLNGSEFTAFNDLNSLLPQTVTMNDLSINHEPLLPCFGWIIEMIMDINKCGSFSNSLINFNKRYLTFKILKELTIEDENDEFTHDTREFEFILKLDESLVNNQNLKEFTLLEKDKLKLFKGILREQHRILVIDNRKRQLKEGKDTSSVSNLSLTTSQQSVTKKSSNSTLRRQSLSYKTNSSSRFKISGFFNKSRGSTGSAPQQLDRVVAARQLPSPEQYVDPKLKPLAVIALKSKKIFPVYLMPVAFKIDSESTGESFLFQCLNDSDLNDWLVKLNYANRHWFYSKQLNIKYMGLNTTFGIPLSVVCERNASLVPKFMLDIFHEIEEDGIKNVGLYRISTSITELNNVRAFIDRHGFLDFSDKSYDPHALTSCVKSYLRDLPESLLPDKVIEAFFRIRERIVEEKLDHREVIRQIREILKVLSTVNFETLRALMKHLNKVCQYSDDNKMNASNLATVIGPALTEASNLAILINNFGFMNIIIERMILSCDTVFEVPLDAESHLGDEDTIKPETIDETREEPPQEEAIPSEKPTEQ